jgi:hypothetical protein
MVSVCDSKVGQTSFESLNDSRGKLGTKPDLLRNIIYELNNKYFTEFGVSVAVGDDDIV